ncbi:MAG: FMN-binding protein [Clostridia bacterium]
MHSIIKPAGILFLICILVALAVAYTYNLTRETILLREHEENMRAMASVMPGAGTFEDITNEFMDNVGDANLRLKVNSVQMSQEGTVFNVSVKGYTESIVITVGILKDHTVSGIAIGRNTETPSIGKKIEEKAFTDTFSGLDAYANLSKEVDIISGATISSRAVIEGVGEVLKAYDLFVRREGNH